MEESPKTRVSSKEGRKACYPHLKKTVLFGYADLLAVGCRTLLGITMGFNYQTVVLPEFSSHTSVKCQRPTIPASSHRYFEPLQILNCKYEEFTIVVVNTETLANKCHYIINHLLTMCRQSQVEKVIALTCLRVELDGSYLSYHTYFENSFNVDKMTTFPSLPGDTPISDPMLCTLIQLFKVEQMPLSILSALGHKAHYGQTLDYDFANQAIQFFQEKLADMTGLEFDYDLSESLVFEEYARCHTMMGMYS